MNNSVNNRIIALDYAKGIGIVLVVFGHVMGVLPDMLPIGKILYQAIYSFHMPLFFVLAGIVLRLKLENSNDKEKGLSVSIFKNLFFVYFAWSLLYIFLNVLLNVDRWLEIVFERGVATLTGRGIAPLWFIFSLLISELVFIGVYRYRRCFRCSVNVFLCLVSLVSLLITVCLQYFNIQTNILFWDYLWISFERLFPSFFFVSFGALIYQIVFINSSVFKSLCLATLLMVIALVLTFSTNNVVNTHLMVLGNPLIYFVVGILGSCAVIFLCLAYQGNGVILSSIGQKSFDIMVLHYPPILFIPLFSLFLHKLGVPHSLWKYVLITILTTFVCYLVSIFILKPVRKITNQVVKLV